VVSLKYGRVVEVGNGVANAEALQVNGERTEYQEFLEHAQNCLGVMTELSQPAARMVRPTSADCMLGAARSAAFTIGLKLAPRSLRCELHLTAKASARLQPLRAASMTPINNLR
jgi:hypothetical protein